MKKTLLLIAAMAVATAASAQRDNKYIGGNLLFGGDLSSAGLGIKGLHYFQKEWRGELGMNVYPGGSVSLWEAYANVHYVIPVADRVNVYPLGGVGLGFWSYDVPIYNIHGVYTGKESETDMNLGLNIGVGAEYELNRKWLLQAELKGQLVSRHSQGVFSLGVAYRFD